MPVTATLDQINEFAASKGWDISGHAMRRLAQLYDRFEWVIKDGELLAIAKNKSDGRIKLCQQ